MPLDPERRLIYERLRALEPSRLTATEARLLEDLMHQEGSSGIQDAIEAGKGEAQTAPSNICWKCSEPSIVVRTTYNGTIRHCVTPGCNAKSTAPCGPSVRNAVPRRQPDPIPVVHMDPNVDYLPNHPPGFRHPGMNYRPEDT